MKITDISPQKKRQDRFNVFIDGEFYFGISAELVFEKKLKIGGEILGEKIEELILTDQTERLFNKALRLLSFRPRSEKEIRDHLFWKGKLSEIKTELEKKHYEASVEKAIDKLKKIKQIDDEEFARWWTGQRKDFSPRPMTIVKKELITKGITKEIIENLLVKNPDEEVSLAVKIGQKKLKSLLRLEKKEKREKLSQFLARRGFEWEIVKKTVDTLVQ